MRPIATDGTFFLPGPGDLICWSRILDVDEALVVVNGHGNAAVGPRSVLVDADLTGAGGTMTVVANTAQAADPATFTGPHATGSTVTTQKAADGTTFITINSLGPSEALVLVNKPNPEAGGILP